MPADFPPFSHPSIVRRFETAARYYVVRCQEDLFGQLLISRYWGSKNSRHGGERHETAANAEQARTRLAALTRLRLRRGYCEVSC